MAITFDHIATTTLTATAATVSFNAFSTSYTSIRVIMLAAQNASGNVAFARYNGFTSASDYSMWIVAADDSAAKSAYATSDSNGIQIGNGYGSNTQPFFGMLDIIAANTSALYKSVIHQFGDGNALQADTGVQMTAGTFKSYQQLSDVTLRINNGTNYFKVGTTLSIYGITKA